VKTPRKLREQIKVYEAAGFHPVEFEPRAGSHWRVRFAEFDEPQFLTSNIVESHSIRNNLARYRRLSQARRDNGSTRR